MRRLALAFVLIFAGAVTNLPRPVAVAGAAPRPIAPIIAAGGDHVCVVASTEDVWCWGRSLYGQVGNGVFANISSPVQVNISDVTAIATGGAHTCAVVDAGAVECWGFNNDGQLGNGNTSNSAVPVPVTGLTGAVSVATGDVHSCALLGDGSVKCWGSNIYGQLGDGTKTNRSTPVTVNGITTAIAIGISGAVGHTCALLANHTVRCWGSNSNGQLGNGTHADSTSPVTVNGITTAVGITAGWKQSCAVLANGTVQCWGRNDSGQLGDGTTTDRPTPVLVQNLTDAALDRGWGRRDVCAPFQRHNVVLGFEQLRPIGHGKPLECFSSSCRQCSQQRLRHCDRCRACVRARDRRNCAVLGVRLFGPARPRLRHQHVDTRRSTGAHWRARRARGCVAYLCAVERRYREVLGSQRLRPAWERFDD